MVVSNVSLDDETTVLLEAGIDPVELVCVSDAESVPLVEKGSEYFLVDTGTTVASKG